MQLARPLRNRLALATAAVLVIALSPIVAVVSAAPASAFAPALQCPSETFPAAGTPRSASGQSYNVPFDAELGVDSTAPGGSEGGYIAVQASGGALSVVLGPKGTYGGQVYTTGTLFGNACGTFSIPSLNGSIPRVTPYLSSNTPDSGNADYNNNFILHGPPFLNTQQAREDPSDPTVQKVLATPIPVAIELPGTGVPLIPLSGTGSADGSIGNTIIHQVAGNGGLNITFTTSAKATATLTAGVLTSMLPTSATSLLPPALLAGLNALTAQLNANGPAECTLSIGDQRVTGYPAADVGPYTTPVTADTDPTASAAAKADGATPVTGPISDAQGIAVSTDIPQPPIESGATPDVAAPGAGTADPSTLCSPTIAALLNGGFGLPSTDASGNPKSADVFVAPVTFRAYTTQ